PGGGMSGVKGPRGPAGGAPSDLELMMLADGELDDERRLEIEALLAEDAPRRSKLRALGLTGELLREGASGMSTAKADGIADAVMAAIAAAPATPVHPVQKEAAAPPSSRRAANDNARVIWFLAAAAAAVAAGFAFWGRAPEQQPTASFTTGAPATEAP